MKNKVREYSLHICPVLIAFSISMVLLFELYLESVCLNYARRTYFYFPLYGIRIAFCFVWAIGARIFIAIRRKKDYKGKAEISISALISVIVLLAIGVIDWKFLTRKLIWNQAFDVMLLLSVLCCVMRKEKKGL